MAVAMMDTDMEVDSPSISGSTLVASTSSRSNAFYERPEDNNFGSLPVESDTNGGQRAEWRYEMRRDAQEIVPGVFLGPLQISKDLGSLRSLGITHIVCVRDAAEAAFVRPRFEGEFQYLVLDVRDREDEMVIRLLASSREFIANAIQAGGRVFIHCGSGISLSPTLVIAYLMQQYTASYDAALNYLQQKRYCVNPNPGFANQLRGFEAIYRAQLTMQQQAATSAASGMGERRPSAARKRSNGDREDEDDPNDVESHRPTSRSNVSWG